MTDEPQTVYEAIVSTLEAVHNGEMQPDDKRIPKLIEAGIADIERAQTVESAIHDMLLSIGKAVQNSTDIMARIHNELNEIEETDERTVQ